MSTQPSTKREPLTQEEINHRARLRIKGYMIRGHTFLRNCSDDDCEKFLAYFLITLTDQGKNYLYDETETVSTMVDIQEFRKWIFSHSSPVFKPQVRRNINYVIGKAFTCFEADQRAAKTID
jgi:hypothetical protein